MKTYLDGLYVVGDPSLLTTDLADEIGSLLESLSVESDWDIAHYAKQKAGVSYAEPDVDNTYIFDNQAYNADLLALESYGEAEVCEQNNEYDSFWPFPQQSGVPHKLIWCSICNSKPLSR